MKSVFSTRQCIDVSTVCSTVSLGHYWQWRFLDDFWTIFIDHVLKKNWVMQITNLREKAGSEKIFDSCFWKKKLYQQWRFLDDFFGEIYQQCLKKKSGLFSHKQNDASEENYKLAGKSRFQNFFRQLFLKLF